MAVVQDNVLVQPKKSNAFGPWPQIPMDIVVDSEDKGMLLTLHCRKWGLDVVTSAASRYQLWFEA